MNHKLINVEKGIHEIKLRQMGADVEVVQGILHYVRFQLDGTTIEYVYHLNNKGDFYLQKLSPYPLNVGTYTSHDDVINIIEHDIEQMQTAKKSKKFDNFIEINQKISTILRNFEDLYCYYNISRVQVNKFEEKIRDLKKLIFETKDMSERVYFKKDPDTL